MAEIDDYKVVPLKLTPNATECHSLYMREHFIRLMDPNKPKGRTLFILNVPPYITKQAFEKVFGEFGKVESVAFAEKPGRDETDKWCQEDSLFHQKRLPFKFKVAYVVFEKHVSVDRALQVSSVNLYAKESQECFVESGMDLWHKQYRQRFIDEAEAQTAIDKYMAAYDARKAKEEREAKAEKVDDDGWVTVTKAGRNAGFEQKEAVVGRLEEKVKRSKKKELKNFYTFQIRESKMQNIVELRQKFQKDKEKIQQLKSLRRFRPF